MRWKVGLILLPSCNISKGLNFFADCAIANFTDQLIQIFVNKAVDNLRHMPNARKVLIGRITHLLYVPYDTNYANPNDTAIAAYLWALSQTIDNSKDRRLIKQYLSGFMKQEFGLWWAKKVYKTRLW